MVRKYFPKRRPWADKNRRMARVVELRDQGLSMRVIAGHLGVSVGTVHADLKRWECERSNVVSLCSNEPFRNAPTGAKLNTASEHAHDAEIIPLRRSS